MTVHHHLTSIIINESLQHSGFTRTTTQIYVCGNWLVYRPLNKKGRYLPHVTFFFSSSFAPSLITWFLIAWSVRCSTCCGLCLFAAGSSSTQSWSPAGEVALRWFGVLSEIVFSLLTSSREHAAAACLWLAARFWNGTMICDLELRSRYSATGSVVAVRKNQR